MAKFSFDTKGDAGSTNKQKESAELEHPKRPITKRSLFENPAKIKPDTQISLHVTCAHLDNNYGHSSRKRLFGVSGDGQIKSANYLAGGIAFGPPPPVGVVSANLTPDSTGKPGGLTLEQFEIALRTGHDPLDPKFGLLAVMPWPYFRHMTNRDLEAIYAFLRAIPSATPGSCAGAGQ